MKKLLTLIILITAISCDPSQEDINRRTVNGVYYSDYTHYTVAHINSLTSPVILIGKEKNMGLYNITIKDSNNIIATYGNMSTFANNIGASRQIGDTIK